MCCLNNLALLTLESTPASLTYLIIRHSLYLPNRSRRTYSKEGSDELSQKNDTYSSSTNCENRSSNRSSEMI